MKAGCEPWARRLEKWRDRVSAPARSFRNTKNFTGG